MECDMLRHRAWLSRAFMTVITKSYLGSLLVVLKKGELGVKS